jgi:peptidoglycan/xylan/chitin deacetylase (PgdA/CDA1 family)
MNRNRIKKIAYEVTRAMSFSALRNYSGEKFIFPFYHLVAEKTPDFIRHLYKAPTPGEFLTDLEFILKYYKPATANDVKKYVAEGKQSGSPKFFLSFDDGLKECYEVVYPILKKKGIQAAFFINPDFVDNKAFFYRFKTSLIIERITNISDEKILRRVAEICKIPIVNKESVIRKVYGFTFGDVKTLDEIAQILDLNTNELLKKQKPYMSMEQLKELESEGFIIGSHSLNHPLFENLSELVQREQVEKSMLFIHENFSPEISVFAFPYTDVGVASSVFDYLEKSKNIDITFGTAGIKKDNRAKHLQRIPMEFDGMNARRILRQEYAYYIMKSLVGRNTVKR